MAHAVVALAALLASGLTFLTGFGLGTLLMPVFALFFPVPLAVALTAVVHFLNNLFKLGLVGRRADRAVVIRFGAPALLAALAGAGALLWLADLAPLARYQLGGRELEVAPVKLVVAVLMVAFAGLELWPRAKRFAVDRKFLPLGGVLSGFFGGVSGHQGAFRSAFLLRLGLEKETYIATGVAIAVVVDLSRLSVYAARWRGAGGLGAEWGMLATATAAAFAGAFAGNRLLKKVTLGAIEIAVAGLLVVIAAGLGLGLL